MNGSSLDPLPAGAFALALAGLPGMGPARLHCLIVKWGPAAAWARVVAGQEGRPPPPLGRPARRPWSVVAGAFDVAGAWRECRRRGVEVTWPGHERWPKVFVADPRPPGVLFWRGDLSALAGPAVALVGTRHATPEGRSVAFELAFDLAAAGVTVVSGLALGIDGAAHAGALEAWDRRAGEGAGVGPTVGVAASGVDVVYPRRHAQLWSRMVTSGAVVSETPPGGAPASWRFPARNRIIVALVAMVVIVESHTSGGSLVTAEAALARGTEVRAVPGPVRAPSSAGTNQFLVDGAAPVRHAGDILDGLGMLDVWPPRWTRPNGVGTDLDLEHRRVLASLGWHPIASGTVVERCGLPLGTVGRCLDDLEEAGLAGRAGGQWTRIAAASAGSGAARPKGAQKR